MHVTSLSSPMRTFVLGSRLGMTPRCHNAITPFHAAITRPASTSATQFQPKTTSTTTTPSRRPQLKLTSSPTSTALTRANSTTSDPVAREISKQLDWNSFFKLRASRRRYSLASSVATSLASTVVGVQFLSTQDLESLGAQVMGLDPFIVLGMATAACGAAGWLAGPFVGNGVWGLVNRRFKQSFTIKEKEFFDRIKRFRVDPSSNSIANPVPDYYGEKIGSVQGYRQWLKDQRVYNRKRRNFII
ncbi:presequence translocated-associated motor subunit PAM17 [Aspergillus candidus]|uniref:Presequence translocated-associated motor subunit PAM17 n=1 Tax=Aspergillus candidus TaxID=41067 RepID=A0A2I2FLR3_ASPCN|nr:Pam17-domain-containing protein [Aspergillus candidus]PLB41577.1 Pam17-domain-containing protein [Aspergillus candidus]